MLDSQEGLHLTALLSTLQQIIQLTPSQIFPAIFLSQASKQGMTFQGQTHDAFLVLMFYRMNHT